MIDDKLKIIDCPGLIYETKNSKFTLLRNIVKIDKI